MSDYETSNDRKDPFSEIFRQRLINKPTPPDANCWDEIEARLQKKRAISPLWLSLAIAASVITAVFIINNLKPDNKQHTYNEAITLNENTSDKETSSDVVETALGNEHEGVIAEVKKKKESTDDKSDEKKDPVSSPDKLTGTTKPPIITETTESALKVDQAESAEQKKEPAKQTEKDSEDAPPVQKNVDNLQYRSIENLMAYDTGKKRSQKKNKNWLMLSGLGSAGGLGYLLSSIVVSSGENEYVFDAPKDNNLGSPGLDPENGGDDKETGPLPEPQKEITDINTSIPVSFGITVRKKLNKTIGIETGLLYTYLSSDLKLIGADHSDATLNLHYLGIPVNLIVNIVDKKRWNLYVSGGGMIDKGLQSVHIKKGSGNNSKERGSISGLQWSLNGGLGVSYNFYEYLNLYVEPGMSYFFDSNQPISRRTENPFSFNFRAGIRYDF